MVAGLGNKLPFGTLPRLLLAWVCSEAVRLQSRELVLGRSLYEFMRKLGMDDRSGSVRGDRTRLKNQMRRLFGCTVTLVYEDAQREVRVSSLVADRAEYWWSQRQADEPLVVGQHGPAREEFFNEIIAHPIPLDLNTLKSLKRSPLGLDCTSGSSIGPSRSRARCASPGGSSTASSDLTRQSGRQGHPQQLPHGLFTRAEKINRAWPDLHYQTVKGALLLSPSPPRIPPAPLRLIND